MGTIEIISTILGAEVVTVIVTHLLTKKKYQKEVDKISTEVEGDTIGNMDKSLEFYEKWVENTNKRLDEVLQNQDRLISENLTLRNELNTVKEQTTRMSTLLCTKLPCNQRVQDASIIECVYATGSRRKARKVAKQKTIKESEN